MNACAHPHHRTVGDLVLVLDAQLRIPAPVRRFLQDFARLHDADPDAFEIQDFLATVWPDGARRPLYAANTGQDPLEADHYLQLLLRPVAEGPLAHEPAVGSNTLGFRVQRKQGCLHVKGVELAPHVLPRHFEAIISAAVCWRESERHMDAQDFEALAGLPYTRATTAKRLSEWNRYLGWKERRIRASQITVPYLAWRRVDATRIDFLARGEDMPDRKVKLVDTEFGATKCQPREEPPMDGASAPLDRKPRHQPRATPVGKVIKTSALDLEAERKSERWGDLKLGPSHGYIRVELNEGTAKALESAPPPHEGTLMSNIGGDLAPLKNQTSGVSRLTNGQGFSPRLGEFIFDSTSAGIPLDVPDLDAIAGGRSLNPGQREAVAKALASPDLCLIQGPPGTGKTTVIAEICLRAARAGQRVLVASQTNLAVDNALSRLMDVPWIRPLRLGNAERVDEEFKDLLAENVIDRWFFTIAGECSDRVLRAKQEREELTARESAVQQMGAALADHTAAERAISRSQHELRQTQQELQKRTRNFAKSRQQEDEHKRQHEDLAAFQQWARRDGVLPPQAAVAPWPVQVAWPSGLDTGVPPLISVNRARHIAGSLDGVVRALDAATGNAPPNPDDAQELHALREEKRGLVDSDEEAAMRRLREINGRIKHLERSGWNQLTGALDRAAREAWPDGPPESIALVVDALAPSSSTADALTKARALVQGELANGTRAAKTIRELEVVWTARLEEQGAVLRKSHAATMNAVRSRDAAQASADSATRQVEKAQERSGAAKRHWRGARAALGIESELTPPSEEALQSCERMAQEDRAEQDSRLARSRRWESIQEEWISRLRAITTSDREHLEALYVRHSNVVGMTCNEAGKQKTWQGPDFKPFDIVIVDEVSKATPPELILPLLLGKRAILVGDHRQLPPMFRERESSFAEAADSGDIAKEEFEGFRNMVTASLFEELFATAPAEIKAMLWTQYRMHPRIMDAVNEFYDGRLEAGPNREQLSASRGHGLEILGEGGERLLAPGQHLLWIDSSKGVDGKPAWEEQRGTSKANALEVRLVGAMLVRLGRALRERGYGPTRKLQTPFFKQEGTWARVLERALPDVPGETRKDLFVERRVRADGRALNPDDPARAGTAIEIQRQRNIGVITFYGGQLKDLRKEVDRLRRVHPALFATMDLRTDTVDRFQGMERSIVLISLVRSKRGGLGNFVREYQRINVGLSRAQQLLVVVGAEQTWTRTTVPLPPLEGGDAIDVPAYRNILELARQAGGRRLAQQIL